MTDEDPTSGITRREALAGGSAAAVAVGAGLYSDALVRRAKALSAGDARIVMGDQAEDPAQDGEVAFNSPDVKIHSGGAVRNVSNISPNVPDWTEDGNSPQIFSGSDSDTYTLTSSWDEVMVRIGNFDSATLEASRIALRVNGDSGNNYNFMDPNGQARSDQTQFVLGEIDSGKIPAQIVVEFSGTWNNILSVHGPAAGFEAQALVIGTNTNVSSPLDTVTIVNIDSTTNISGTWQVFGRDTNS